MKEFNDEVKESTKQIHNLIAFVINAIVAHGKALKNTGGEFPSIQEIAAYVNTLFALSNVGDFQDYLEVNGGIYTLDLFKVNAAIAEALIIPRAVKMPGTSLKRKDLRIHYDVQNVLTPSAFMRIQSDLIGQFKGEATTVSPTQYLAEASISEATVIAKGLKAHVDDLSTVKSIPWELTCVDELYEESYFDYPLEEVVGMVIQKMILNIRK